MVEETFPGFPSGKHVFIHIPEEFFSELLPRIDHLVEMQVTLYCFWALQAQDSDIRYVRFSEVCQDELFMSALARQRDHDAVNTLREGFERAVLRGTLLHVHITLETGEVEDIYFMNTEKGRQAVAAIERQDWIPGDNLRPIALVVVRPNIYKLYEKHISAITPFIAEQLHDLEKDYPAQWLIEALEDAALKNRRTLHYVINLLKQWEKERGRKPLNQQEQDAYLEYLKKKYVQSDNETS